MRHTPPLAILSARSSHRDDHMARVRANRRVYPIWTPELSEKTRGEIVSTPYTCMPSALGAHSSHRVTKEPSLLRVLADGIRLIFSDPLIIGIYAFCGGVMMGLLIAGRY